MASYTTNLKTWGATGSEYPNGYNYVEGEQPVDAWDNFFNHNVITDVDHLVTLTNDRIESDKQSGSPSSPEDGHLWYDTDDGKLYWRDNVNSLWEPFLSEKGGTMQGALDMNGNAVNDSSASALTLGDDISVSGTADIDGARLDHKWYSKQEGGTVTNGNSVVLVTAEVPDGGTFAVTQGHLSKDGFDDPVASGVDLVISSAGQTGKQATVFSGDGSTFFDSTGNALASYTNTSGGPEQVALMIDNGQYGTGSGVDEKAYGGGIVRVY